MNAFRWLISRVAERRNTQPRRFAPDRVTVTMTELTHPKDKHEIERIIKKERGVLRRNPQDARAHYVLGAFLQARGSTAESRAELTRGLALDPTSPYAPFARNVLEQTD